MWKFILVRVWEVIKGNEVSSCCEEMHGFRNGTDTKVSSQGKHDSGRMRQACLYRRLRACDKDDPQRRKTRSSTAQSTDKQHVQGIHNIEILGHHIHGC